MLICSPTAKLPKVISYTFHLQDPPVLVIGCSKSPGRPQDEKDTLLDILETRYAS